MAIISSLLCLQSENISDGRVRSIFADSTNRIQAMALVHEKLYQSRDLSHIKIQEYVRSLAQHIFYSYNIGDKAVDLFLEIEEVLLGIDEIIPFGLILNELISNTLKHAFGNTSRPAIRIGLRYADERAVLTVSDNGCGFPEGFDFHDSHTLGFQLVSTLNRQLRGEIAISGEGGTHITLTFPVPPQKED
jgi:two-component sensor histidine kinase